MVHSYEEVDLEDELPSIVSPRKQEDEFVNVIQYVVYSSTFCVPVFYFLAFDRGMNSSPRCADC